jgi:nitrogen-specific signal transduction histidine kinase
VSSFGPLVVLDGVVTLVFVALAAWAARFRHRPGAGSAGLLWVALAAVSAVVTLNRLGVLDDGASASAVVLGWMVAVPLWAGFVFAHVGRGPTLNRWWIATAVGYVGLDALATTQAGAVGGLVGQFVRVGTAFLQTTLVGVGLFGVFLVVHATVTYNDLRDQHAVTLSVGGLATSLLLFAVSAFGTTAPETLPWTVSAWLGVTAAAFATSVFTYRLFADAPGAGPLARRSVLEEMSDAVLVANRNGRLVDANESAERTFDVDLDRDAGVPVESVLGADPTNGDGPTTVATADGNRQFEVRRSDLSNARGGVVGRSYRLRDVTAERTREQRLDVFNRVLRHNLRNDLDAIRGFAEVLSEESVAEPDEVAGRIRDTATDLADVGETVERADRVLTQGALATADVDLDSLVASVATAVEERYDCQVTRSVEPAGLTIPTDRGVLRTALLEVVANAAEHTDTDEPTVHVAVRARADGATITVRDDGPGIPERERSVLLDGEESPLQHGTGVGLWFVSWAVTRLGGDVNFDEPADGGTEVEIWIPDRPAS